MIWDYIRDFIVQYITGGYASDHNFYGGLVGFDYHDGGGLYSHSLCYDIGWSADSEAIANISLADWLATTITAVIMVLMVVLACLLVRWVFKLVVSGFLARR